MLEIKEITDQKQWQDFTTSLHPNTFLQSWEWGEFQLAEGEQILRLGFFNGNQQVACALVIIVNAKRGRHYLVPHGPLLVHPPDKGGRGGSSSVHLQETLIALTTHLKSRARQDRVVALRIAPLTIDTPSIRKIFADQKFHPAPLHVHAELTWTLDISKSEEELLQGMRKTTRHAIRKAEKAGVTIGVSTDPIAIDRFYPLYEQTINRHHFVPYTKQVLETQRRIFTSTDNLFIVTARYQDQDVASAICFQFANTVFYYHGASQKVPGNIPAAQFLQWSAIQEAQKRGATRYNFWGIAPDDQPSHPFAGITIFKKGFGGQEYNYLHAQDLPLSIKYWSFFIIETIRRYKRGF